MEQHTTVPVKARRLLTWPDLKARGWPFGRMHTDRLEREGEFPRRVRPGGRVVCWWSDEFENFLEALPRGAAPQQLHLLPEYEEPDDTGEDGEAASGRG
jgi:predicted DNA-binding transcriptional regulator AlpA